MMNQGISSAPFNNLGWYSETGHISRSKSGHKSASYNTAMTIVNRYSEIGFSEVLSHLHVSHAHHTYEHQ